MRTTLLLVATISSLSLALAVIAFLRHDDSPATTANDNAALQREIADLRAEIERLERAIDAAALDTSPSGLAELERRVAALESRTTPEPMETAAVTLEQIENLDDENFEKLIDDERMMKLTSKALDKIQRRKASVGMRRWVNPGRDGLEGVLRRTFATLSLDPQRQEQVRRIVWDANDAQNELMDQLDTDPAPSHEESMIIMGEVKEVFGQRNEELDEVLDDDEMHTFHRIEAEEVKAGPDSEEEEDSAG